MDIEQARPNLDNLPVELQLQIYGYINDFEEGITIAYDREQNRIKSQKNITCMHRVCRSMYHSSMDLLYNGNTFKLDLYCADALKFLQSLNPSSRKMIKYVCLTSAISRLVDQNFNMDSICDLVNVMTRQMSIRELSLHLPQDQIAGTCAGRDYHWWVWYVQWYLCRSFGNRYTSEKHFDSIRLIYPKHYTKDVAPYSYMNVLYYLQSYFLGEERSNAVMSRRNDIFEKFLEDLGNILKAARTSLSDVNRMVERAWKDVGLEIVKDVSRAGEPGTVLVVRRLAP